LSMQFSKPFSLGDTIKVRTCHLSIFDSSFWLSIVKSIHKEIVYEL
jgi:acyl dehydratase